jgi:hypothetical protein
MTILVSGWMWPVSAWALDHIVGQQCEKLMDGFIPMISPSDHVKAVFLAAGFKFLRGLLPRNSEPQIDQKICLVLELEAACKLGLQLHWQLWEKNVYPTYQYQVRPPSYKLVYNPMVIIVLSPISHG